jgi:hypothetical protein
LPTITVAAGALIRNVYRRVVLRYDSSSTSKGKTKGGKDRKTEHDTHPMREIRLKHRAEW